MSGVEGLDDVAIYLPHECQQPIRCPADIAALTDLQARLEAAEAQNAKLREALAPFAAPPLYVFDSDRRFVPTPQPDGWIGGGWFSTADFERARATLGGEHG